MRSKVESIMQRISDKLSGRERYVGTRPSRGGRDRSCGLDEQENGSAQSLSDRYEEEAFAPFAVLRTGTRQRQQHHPPKQQEDDAAEEELLSVSAQLRFLIDQASSPSNLCQMYPGWQPAW